MSNKSKRSSKKILEGDLNVCPLCQLPLHFLKITGDAHLMRCEKNVWENSNECSDGKDCFSSDFHHYWDFTHTELAEYRSSNLNYLKVDNTDNRSPVKSNDKKKTANKRKHKVLSENDSDDDIGNDKASSSTHNKKQNIKDEDNSDNKESVSLQKNEDDKLDSKSVVKEKKNENNNNIKSKSLSQKKKIKKNKLLSNAENYDNGDDDDDVFWYYNEINKKVRDGKSGILLSSNSEENDVEPIHEINEKNDLISHFLCTSQELFASQELSNNDKEVCGKNTKDINTKSKNLCDNAAKFNLLTSPNKYLSPEVSPYKELNTSQSSLMADMLMPEVQLEMNSSSDDDCEVNSETGEILFTEKIVTQILNNEDNSRNNQRESNLKAIIKNNHEKNKIKADSNKSNKQLQIEEWKKILNNNKPQNIANKKSKTNFNEQSIELDKRIPFYKLIPDTDFVVDGFKNGVIQNKNNYFLSHFHYDHYIGLNKHFNKTIHCSTITSELLKNIIKIDEKYLRIINVNDVKIINQVEVTALDANHCPGALMFIFRTLHGQSYLHVGDFRADSSMERIHILKNTFFDKVYLDTTYCNPNYNFPPQSVVLNKLISLIQENHRKVPNTLYLCGSYTIGKEKVYITILEKMKWHIYVESYKRKILRIINNPVINSLIVENPTNAKLHVISMSKLNNINHLNNYYDSYSKKYKNIIAIKPTGWVFNEKTNEQNNINIKKINENISIYEISYSEHSSFIELCKFVRFIKHKQLICTVNPKNNGKQIQTINNAIKKNKINNENNSETLTSYFNSSKSSSK